MPGQPHNYSVHTKRLHLCVTYHHKLNATLLNDSSTEETLICFSQAACTLLPKPSKRTTFTLKAWCWRKRSLKSSLVWRKTQCRCSQNGEASSRFGVFNVAVALDLQATEHALVLDVNDLQRYVDSLCGSGGRGAQILCGGGSGDEEAQAGSFSLWAQTRPCSDWTDSLPLVSSCSVLVI